MSLHSAIPKKSYPRIYTWQDNVEELERYIPGGYHPLHLGDELHNGRYRIIHKLGFGTYSTVWLAQDRYNHEKLVSLKVLISGGEEEEGSLVTAGNRSQVALMRHLNSPPPARSTPNSGCNYIVQLLDVFRVVGPNGTHMVHVTEPLGPSIAMIHHETDGSYFPISAARVAALQVAQGLSYIHSRDVVHGDLHTGNILIAIPGLSTWTIAKVNETFGPPKTFPVTRVDGTPLTASSPRYVVRPLHPLCLLREPLTSETAHIRIIDFGESFFARNPPPCNLNTPLALAAPEILFGDNHLLGKATDVWTLACTLYEIYGGQSLFGGSFGTREEVLGEVVGVLGPLPGCWRWEGHKIGDVETMADRFAWFGEVGVGETEGQCLQELCQRMLRYIPEERVDVEEVVRGLKVLEDGTGAQECGSKG